MWKLAALLARYFPFANGSGRVLDLLTRNVDLGVGRKLARTSDGFAIEVFPDDLIGRHLLLSGKFDRSIVQVLLDRAKPGDVLLDIGANIGYVTACFLKKIPGSTAVCIEPQPGVSDLLRTNLAQFGSRADIHEVALSDQSKEVSFHVDVHNRGASYISDTGKVRVRAVRASDLVGRMPRINLIKIDVEGHEFIVLREMAQEIVRLRPRAILFEDQSGEASPVGRIGSLLTSAGYSIYGVRKALWKTSLAPVVSASDCLYNDYLALAH